MINKIQCKNCECKMIIDPNESFTHLVKFHPKFLEVAIDAINHGEFISNPTKTCFRRIKK